MEGKWQKSNTPIKRGRAFKKYFFYKKIRHHLIDFVNPKKQYSAALFQQEAKKIIADILRRDKLPILCGGTAQWIDAVVFDQQIPDVKPNAKLRAKLEKKSADELYLRLKKLDPHRAANIDRRNKRHLIRALEIVISTGRSVPPLPSILEFSLQGRTSVSENIRDPEPRAKLDPGSRLLLPGMEHFDSLWFGINPPQSILFAKIKTRLKQRLDAGMTKEVSRLHRQGLSWKKLENFGLEYKFVSLYLQKKLTYDEMFEQLFIAIKQYSKRQMRWWKKNKEIRWMATPAVAEKLAKKFLVEK